MIPLAAGGAQAAGPFSESGPLWSMPVGGSPVLDHPGLAGPGVTG
jgi:hypothetical protein